MNLLRNLLLLTALMGTHASGMSFKDLKKVPSAIMNGITGTIVGNPIPSAIGLYYLICDREAIRENTFWTAIWGSCMLSSFITNIFSIKGPKNFITNNFIAKTIYENSFLSIIAAHTLLFHRNTIKDNPLGSMLVGGGILYELSKNYRSQYCQEGETEQILMKALKKKKIKNIKGYYEI